MKNIITSLIILISQWTFGQIAGIVKDKVDRKPIPYVNVWIKNTLVGATTGEDGKFSIENVKIGDTIHISSLGYNTIEFLAEKDINAVLQPKINELDEVVVFPMKNSTEYLIESYQKIKKNRVWYNNGFYSLARFYKYRTIYENTRFVSQIGLITFNAKNENVIFRIRLLKVNPGGEPSEYGLTENIILESKKGIDEIVLDLSKEKILFPKNGFFIVVDRLNIEENKFFNKTAKMDILQPAIGMERTDQEKNTWLGYGGRWMPPLKMKDFLGTNGNIAINIKLTN
ncbi:MAG: carboxypeptidase-like regulatory domain-containing protein [Arenibacter algicola]